MPDTASQPQPQKDLVEQTKQYLEQKGVQPDASSGASVASSNASTGAAAGDAQGQDGPGVAATAAPGQSQPQPQNQQTQAQQADTGQPSDQPEVSVKGMTSLADALYTKRIIDEQTLRSVKFEALTNNITPEQILLDKKVVDEEEVQRTKAEMYGLGFIDLSSITIQPQVLNKISKDLASRNMAVAFEETSNRIKVAMKDPLDLQKVKYLESVVGKRVDAYFATEAALRRIIDTKYGAQIGEAVSEALEDVGVVDITTGSQVADLSQGGGDGATRLVNMILDYAVKHGASDVHIEPREGRVVVRFRVHGLLTQQLNNIPQSLGPAIVSRIKILANMKIDEHRVPQDNRFQIKTGDRVIDVRVSVMPSIYGEKVVMRLLEKGTGIIPLEKTGLRGPGYKAYREALSRTQGIILITGPTGSGKTVTLASSLAILNKQEVNIMTIEDPVEIRIDGITQVQVNPQVGLTFAKGLRSFLRQDPDIVMVGEIRDQETAELAVQASLTGHLVLATLHTNSAAGALPRLLNMGIEPFLLSSTINVIAGQRLVRSLCDECKQPYQADQKVLDMLHQALDPLGGFGLQGTSTGEPIHFDENVKEMTLYKAVGCPKCDDTGYKGRVGIFEILRVSDKISQLIMARKSENEIAKQAEQEGMITMVQDGFMKALEGVTTIEEVLRVQNT